VHSKAPRSNERIQALTRLTSEGKVYGLDHSQVMLDEARARNRRAVDEGRVILMLGTAADLDTLGLTFDKALVVNNLGMWPDPKRGLKNLRRMMKPGGRVAIVSQPRCPGATDKTTRAADREIAAQLQEAGFIELKTETLPLRPPVTCVLGHAPTIGDGVLGTG
jgi:ubiquinone/menaquinone biosynthesis C-methylase UbiE